jgi:hypothetical protein
MPLIGRARSGVVRPDQGQEVTGLGGSQARTNKHIQAKFWRPYAAEVSAGLSNAKAGKIA